MLKAKSSALATAAQRRSSIPRHQPPPKPRQRKRPSLNPRSSLVSRWRRFIPPSSFSVLPNPRGGRRHTRGFRLCLPTQLPHRPPFNPPQLPFNPQVLSFNEFHLTN